MTLFDFIITPIISAALVLAGMPLLRKGAIAIQLVDKPNARKNHTGQVPLAGGIAVWIASMATVMVSNPSWLSLMEIRYILAAGSTILLVGIVDDKMDLRASLKLIIQFGLAYFAFAGGIRIESLHGIFGIYEIPLLFQFGVTVIVITGVVNAFNLMDGIDGLAAGLSLVAFSMFTFLAVLTGNTMLAYLYLSITGALLGFMRFNLSKSKKVFMGDAGSLFMGFVLVVSAITLIQSASGTADIWLVLSMVIGVLALPVLDSLRVYRSRAKQGYSPFRADRTHFHHLVLGFGVRHTVATVVIVFLSTVLIGLSVTIGARSGITATVLTVLIVFVVITCVLGLHNSVVAWKEKVRNMEQSALTR